MSLGFIAVCTGHPSPTLSGGVTAGGGIGGSGDTAVDEVLPNGFPTNCPYAYDGDVLKLAFKLPTVSGKKVGQDISRRSRAAAASRAALFTSEGGGPGGTGGCTLT